MTTPPSSIPVTLEGLRQAIFDAAPMWEDVEKAFDPCKPSVFDATYGSAGAEWAKGADAEALGSESRGDTP